MDELIGTTTKIANKILKIPLVGEGYFDKTQYSKTRVYKEELISKLVKDQENNCKSFNLDDLPKNLHNICLHFLL